MHMANVSIFEPTDSKLIYTILSDILQPYYRIEACFAGRCLHLPNRAAYSLEDAARMYMNYSDGSFKR